MTETVQDEVTGDVGEAVETQRKRAEATNFLAIVRGRFPLLLVHAVRFDEVLGKMGNKDVAAKLATSVGKVFDIRKGRNFAYLTKEWKPTGSDVTDAKAWAEQIGGTNAKGLPATGDKALVTKIVEQYEAAGLASAAGTGGPRVLTLPAPAGNRLFARVGPEITGASAPQILPPAGTYAKTVTIALQSLTPGATIRYTTDGSAPSAVAGMVYGDPFVLTASAVVRAMAVAPGLDDSPISSAAYIVTP